MIFTFHFVQEPPSQDQRIPRIVSICRPAYRGLGATRTLRVNGPVQCGARRTSSRASPLKVDEAHHLP